jgi:ketosteroid isomerase-like protein
MRALHKLGDPQILALQREFCAFKDSYDDMNFTPPLLSTITARTLIIHGDRDDFFPVRIPVEVYTSIPRSYLWIVPNGGHIPIFSNRAEFTRLAADFLKGAWDKPSVSVGEVHQTRFRLMVQNDLDALAPLLAEDLVYIHTTGEMESKPQLLDRLRSGALRYRSIEPSETVIRTTGDLATITGRAKMAVTIGGTDRDFEMRYTAVYRSTGGRWQLVSWQSTRIQ